MGGTDGWADQGGLLRGGDTGGCIGVSGHLGQREQWMTSPDIGRSSGGSETQKPIAAGVLSSLEGGRQAAGQPGWAVVRSLRGHTKDLVFVLRLKRSQEGCMEEICALKTSLEPASVYRLEAWAPVRGHCCCLGG